MATPGTQLFGELPPGARNAASSVQIQTRSSGHFIITAPMAESSFILANGIVFYGKLSCSTASEVQPRPYTKLLTEGSADLCLLSGVYVGNGVCAHMCMCHCVHEWMGGPTHTFCVCLTFCGFHLLLHVLAISHLKLLSFPIMSSLLAWSNFLPFSLKTHSISKPFFSNLNSTTNE